MLDRMIEKAREQEIFSSEDTPTEQRVLAVFLYHAGLSYRKIEPFVERSYEAIRQWFHRLKHLFEPDCQERQEVAVDETKIDVDGQTLYVWAAVDCDTLEVLHVDVSLGRSSLDALLFLKEMLTRCRGRPLVRADRGPWYDWPLGLLECDAERETWGNRSLIEAWFGLFKYRTRRFWHRFPYRSTPTPPDHGSQPSPHSTMLRSKVDTPLTVREENDRSPGSLLRAATALLMYAYPQRHINFQYERLDNFFTEYSTADGLDTGFNAQQYREVAIACRDLCSRIEDYAGDASMIDVQTLVYVADDT